MADDAHQIDYAFECDAPTFVDFNKLRQGEWDDEDIDSWFDTHRDEEGGVFIVDEDVEEVIHLNDEEAKELIIEDEQPEEMEDKEDREVDEGETQQEGLEEVVKETNDDTPSNAFEDNFGSATNADNASTEQEEQAPTTAEGSASSNTCANDYLALWKQMLAKKQESSQPKPLASRPTAALPKTFGHGSQATAHSTKVTFPETPEVYRRHQKRKLDHAKNSEDMEMEVIAKKRREAVQVLQMSKASFERLRSTRAPHKVRKVKPPTTTKVQEFKFHSHKGEKKSSAASSSANPSQFPMTLRSSGNVSVKHTQKKDIKPFNVATVAAKKGDGENYVSVAQAVANFHKKTPPRFRSVTAKEHAAGPPKGEGGLRVTHPQSPNLLTKAKSRPTAVPSTKEKEEQELAQLQKFKFKARPLNPKIFQPGYQGLCGVVREEVRAPTIPVAPRLATAEREAKRKQSEQAQDQTGFVFKALDPPKGMFEGVKGLPEKRAIPVTVPQSPAFELKKRKLAAEHEVDIASADSDDGSSEASSSILSQPEKPVFRPHLEHKHTEPCPFPFEQRYQGKARRQDLVQKELEKQQQELAQKRKFAAQDVPEFQPMTERPTTVATKPQPFHLLTEARGAKYQEEFDNKVKQEVKESKMRAEFKATENSAIFAQPFVPNLAATRKPLGEVPAFRLNTEVRAEQRAAYEEAKRLHEEEQQRVFALEKEELEREEQRQLMEHRKMLVHHAQPVRQFKPLEIKKSAKALTAPVAPHFAVDERLCRQHD